MQSLSDGTQHRPKYQEKRKLTLSLLVGEGPRESHTHPLSLRNIFLIFGRDGRRKALLPFPSPSKKGENKHIEGKKSNNCCSESLGG